MVLLKDSIVLVIHLLFVSNLKSKKNLQINRFTDPLNAF